jgi:hypothetical protein
MLNVNYFMKILRGTILWLPLN